MFELQNGYIELRNISFNHVVFALALLK